MTISNSTVNNNINSEEKWAIPFVSNDRSNMTFKNIDRDEHLPYAIGIHVIFCRNIHILASIAKFE